LKITHRHIDTHAHTKGDRKEKYEPVNASKSNQGSERETKTIMRQKRY